METVKLANPVAQLLPAWANFHAATGIGPIRDESHYRRMAEILETLLAETGGDENHPAMGLADIVSDLIEDYEAEHYPTSDATGIQALSFLMDQHGLGISDLPELGNPAAVEEVLAGQRELSIVEIRALARRFAVSPATFIQSG